MTKRDLTKGCFSSIAEDTFEGKAIKRLMFCYLSVGCAHYRREEGGCTMCAFPAISTLGEPVSVADLNAQLDNCLAEVDWEGEGLSELNLFCSGSFFNDEEIPPPVRAHAIKRARELKGLKKLLVESRPEYIDVKKIRKTVSGLGPDIRLEVAIGLESANDHVREEVINKGFGRDEFEDALAALGKGGAALLVYLFLKPPGLSEREALEDTEESVRYVFSRAEQFGLPHVTAAVQPAFVQREGYLYSLYERGEYKTPWLWTVVELIKRVHGLGEVQIGTSEDSPPPIDTRKNCGECDEKVEQAISRYNETQKIEVFADLTCPCQKRWSAELV